MRLFRSSNCCLSVWRRLAGRRLGQQLLGRRRAGARGQLLGQVVGQLHELLVGRPPGRSRNAGRPSRRRWPSGRRRRRSGRTVVARPARFSIDLRARLAQQLDRLVRVAAGLLQGLLAVHHGQAGLLAKRLDGGRGNLCHWIYLPYVVWYCSIVLQCNATMRRAHCRNCAASMNDVACRRPSPRQRAAVSDVSRYPPTAGRRRLRPALASARPRPPCRPAPRRPAACTINSIERMLSSLPGIGRSTSSGSQSVSIRATVVMPSLRASRIAFFSFRGSIDHQALGQPVHACGCR